jgi:Putative F0F1-ATPase subunit Ca2+/Mg2+ transporter
MPGVPPETGSPEGGPPHSPASGPRLFDLLVVGTACALCIIVAGGIGYLLDSWLHTLPWLTFAGLAFGIVSAVMLAVVRLRPFLQDRPKTGP